MERQQSSDFHPPISAKVPCTGLDSIIERGAQAVANRGVLKGRQRETGRRQRSHLIEDTLVQARLVMLGTIHRDKDGGLLLSGWLDRVKPEVITLEFSLYGMLFRKVHGPELRKRVGALIREMAVPVEQSRAVVQALSDYIDLPYEYAETSRYADGAGVPLHLLDVDRFSMINLWHVQELIDERNLRTWLGDQTSRENEITKERALARLFFDKGVRAFAYTDEMLTRDRHIVEKLASLAHRYNGKRILHVCGWQHLVDQGNLYHTLNPVKVFLHDRTLRV